MINNIEVPKSKFIQKRPKRTFSIEEKLKFYAKWKKSGLSISKFCEENDLVISAFSNWRKKFSVDKSVGHQDNWVPVTTKEQPVPNNFFQVQIIFSNTTKIFVSLLLFLMVLFYAIKVIR